jgi:hypothetical protein
MTRAAASPQWPRQPRRRGQRETFPERAGFFAHTASRVAQFRLRRLPPERHARCNSEDMLRLAGAPLEALTLPISRPMGPVWLAATIVLGVAAAALAIRLIVPALADLRPSSNHATYQRRVAAAMARPGGPARLVTADDLARLPALVRGYLTRVGVVGQPRVRTLRVRFHGAIREDAGSAWMPFTGEQHSTFDEPERLFFLRATRAGLPVDGLHAFRADDASMRIRLASLVTVADVSGGTLVRSETVTFLNDLCLFAPAALVDAPIAWEDVDARSVRARYTLGRQQVSAVLTFDAAGDLVDFRSEDRRQDAGGADRLMPWSTPVSRFRTFAGAGRLPGYGEGWWHPAEGGFAYLRIEIDDITYNVGGP